MSFFLLFLSGMVGGVLGGMGMGGGTALIPLLTLFLGLPQTAAQGINLLAFFPMAALTLPVHAKNGLLKKEGLVFLVLPALVLSAAGALLAAHLPGMLLRRAFGAFLIVLSAVRIGGHVQNKGGKAGEKRQKTW